MFSVEHPVFTAYGNQDWIYNEQGNPDHWPVDRYFVEGERQAVFLGETVKKYHRTLTTYLGAVSYTHLGPVCATGRPLSGVCPVSL